MILGLKKNCFSQAIESDNSRKWINTVNKELKSMDDNGLWDFVKLSNKCKKVNCKWVFNTKHDVKDIIKWYIVRLVTKSFT